MGTPETPAEDRVAEYLAKASESWQLARAAKNPEAQQSFDALAIGWQQLAEQIARSAKRKR